MTEHKNSTRRAPLVPAISAATLFAVAFLLATIPGNPVVSPYVYPAESTARTLNVASSRWFTVGHYIYLRHDGDYAQYGNGLSTWSFGDNVRFTLAPLLVNVALLVVGTFVIGWIVRRRLQKHGWRFGVIHLMMAMLCASIVVAFFVSRCRLHEAQIIHLRRGQQNINFAEWQPFGPHWLRDITGPRFWQWGDRLVAADVEHSDEITDLPGKNAIKVLRIFTVKCDVMPSLDEYDNLLAIDMCMVNYDYSNFDGDGDPAFWPCLLIAQRDSLQGLNLYETGVSDRGLKELAGMPNLTNLDLSANPDVTDNGLLHLASIESLRKLGLWGTSVTKSGVEKLQEALPNCEIGWDETSQ